ncbi:MAG: gamma-glutamyl-phosphate reductase, partial [Solirubrobacteraceae bacterium]
MATATESVQEVCRAAKGAARALASLESSVKNAALSAIATALETSTREILDANAQDVAAATEAGVSDALIDRLTLDRRRIEAMASGVREVAALADPVGEGLEELRRPDGLTIRKVRVPLGVVAVVYEARP